MDAPTCRNVGADASQRQRRAPTMSHVETIEVQGKSRALLNVDEACEVTQIGRSRLYLMLRSGELRSVHVGRSLRIPARGVREWLERQANQDHRPDAA